MDFLIIYNINLSIYFPIIGYIISIYLYVYKYIYMHKYLLWSICIYDNSLTWILRPFWDDSPYKHDSRVRANSEVAIIYPDPIIYTIIIHYIHYVSMQIGYPNNEAVTSMFVRVVRFTGHRTPKKMPGLRPASPPLDQSLPQVFHMQVKLNPKLIRLLWRFAGSVRHSDQDLPGVVSSVACIPTSVVPSLPAAIPASPLIGFVPSSWRSCPPGFQVPQQSSSSAFLRRAGAALPVLPAGCDRPLFSGVWLPFSQAIQVARFWPSGWSSFLGGPQRSCGALKLGKLHGGGSHPSLLHLCSFTAWKASSQICLKLAFVHLWFRGQEVEAERL